MVGSYQDGEFTLRAEDWSAPIVEFSKLATFLDDARAGTTLEAVVFIKPEQKEVAANLIRGAGSPYKFLLIYLDKKEGCRTPGMIDGKLALRQAVVTRISSDQNLSGVPQPKGITANAVKIQPATETAVLFMKVYKNYASADFWKRFGSKSAPRAHPRCFRLGHRKRSSGRWRAVWWNGTSP
eukprot:s12415_g1.t1